MGVRPPPLGRVYGWTAPDGGDGTDPPRALRTVVRLRNLTAWSAGSRGLRGRFASVYNAAVINLPGLQASDPPRPTPIGDAAPDELGNLIFDPGRGGGRIDKVPVAAPDVRGRYVQAARFGEVNTYHHLDAIASHVDELLAEVGAPSLPPVTAVVYAHAATWGEGARDGRRCPDGRWVPFQGGHYRLPGPAARIVEPVPLAPDGEIHLGPGQKLARAGALAQLVGGPYRANASHNPAIIYHEYGHHISRHTADFCANRLRPPERQSNRKTAVDEGSCDYWAAALLGTPHIWFFHHATDAAAPHRRSLLSTKTVAAERRGDPHASGTIWAAALWQLRDEAIRRAADPAGGRLIDRLLVQALLLIGAAGDPGDTGTGPRDAAAERPPLAVQALERARVCARARRSFRRAGAALLEADALLYHGALRDPIARALAARGIRPEASHEPAGAEVASDPRAHAGALETR